MLNREMKNKTSTNHHSEARSKNSPEARRRAKKEAEQRIWATCNTIMTVRRRRNIEQKS